jgi:hypothetical protein
MGQTADERRARRAIVQAWQEAGRPPCPVCATVIEGDKYRVSHLWEAVVHPFCVQARAGRPAQVDLDRGACSFYPDRCPIPFRGRRGDYCVCPALAGCNAVIVARRFGQRTVKVAVYTTPAETGGLPASRPNLVELARRAGLGTVYRGVPPRENPAFDAFRKYGVPAQGIDQASFESFFNEPATWYAPPEYLTIDVDRTIREGRFIVATPAGDG